jgi:hypothetical protein
LAENDQELLNLLVKEFQNMESPEKKQPLREWLRNIVNVLEELGSYKEANGRNLARIENLVETLKIAQIFLANFECKELFACCHSLLLDLIEATKLEEVDDEVSHKFYVYIIKLSFQMQL